MKIFLTGGTGFLGQHVARQCVEYGHNVTALVRKAAANSQLQRMGIRIINGDLASMDALVSGASDADAVIHCAADISMNATSLRRWSANTDGVANLVEASKRASIQKFIFVSTANTIKTGTQALPGDESQPNHATENDLPYVRSKAYAEQHLIEEFHGSGLPVCILNPTFILGPGQSSSSRLIKAMINNRLMIHTPGNKDIVDVRDVANAIVNSLEKGRDGERYLISNESISYADLIEMVSSYSRKRVLKMPMPYPFWKIVGYSGTLLGATVNHKTIELACKNHYYNSAKARRELSFAPRPLHETVRDTVAWLSSQSSRR